MRHPAGRRARCALHAVRPVPAMPSQHSATTAAEPVATGSADTDILVIGGGPAGTTTATLLARRGWRVTLLEKARHPRFHIGESLLPMNLPILERLGVLEQVRAIGVHKPGADFPVDASRSSTFRFARALRPGHGHAFQVKREEFDQLLFRHAVANGVDAREEHRVESLEWEEGRPVGALARDGAGAVHRFRFRYLVDASGRDTFLGNALALKRRNRRHVSAALFSHFRGVAHRDGEDGGNITVLRFAHGWIWVIPLRDGVTSVGAVGTPEFMKQRQGDSEGLLMRTLLADPSLALRMRDAQRIAPVHVTGNYSYTSRRMAGPGWVMVGDAFAFIDPVFSSGVYLGMNSGEAASLVVDGALREPAREAALQRAMDRRLRRGLREFSWFIYRFTTPVMKQLFDHPRNVWQVEQAVISLLAGDVFDAPAVRRRLRLFRSIYFLTALAMAPRAIASWWRRRRQRRVGFEGDTLQQDAA